jgi:deoxyadenosine/deoxycytidine kinase
VTIIDIHEQPKIDQKPLVGVVGVCSAGKSTLIEGLNQRGINARHIAQEHSYVQDMWKRITNPDILIFLDTSYLEATKRGQLNWTEAEWDEQKRRLAHAQAHADIYIHTDTLSIEQVLKVSIDFYNQWVKIHRNNSQASQFSTE